MYGCKRYFDTVKIYELYSKYITREEASRILAISVPTLQNWIRANRMSETLIGDPDVEEEDAHIFDKEQLIQWRNDRFTSNEAVQALGVTKATLYRWSKKEAKTFRHYSRQSYWFLKQDVLKLKS